MGSPLTIIIAQNFAMDWSMLWKDLVGGFLIAGALSAFVPAEAWAALLRRFTGDRRFRYFYELPRFHVVDVAVYRNVIGN
jgi:hypothetical protein